MKPPTIHLPSRLHSIVTVSLLWITLYAASGHAAELSRFAPLLQRLDEIQRQHQIPAYALILTSPQDVLLDAVRGVAAAGSNRPVARDAYFRIGSITKTFVALSALAAESQGKLKLSAAATDYLGGDLFVNSFRSQSPVTLAQLLEHSAGFADMGRAEFAANDAVTLRQGLKRFAKGRHTRWPPGRFHAYSNTGYGLAGRMLEVATQMDIDIWLSKAVFKPLQMKSATMQKSILVDQYLLPGYQADGITPIPYWHMIYPSLGAINLQPRDMAKLLQMYLRGGEGLLTKAQIHRQETPMTTLAAKQGLTYGYGLGLYQWYRKGHLFYGHGGDADGYLAHFAYQKEARLGYFVVINTFNNRAKNQMRRALDDFVVAQIPAAVRPAQSKVTQASKRRTSGVDLSRYAGDYRAVASRFGRKHEQPPLRIKWQAGQLFISESAGAWEPLIWVAQGLFRRSYEPAASAAIIQENGSFWFQGDEGNFVKP